MLTYINIIVVVFIKIARKSKACAKTKLRLEYCTLLIAEKENIQDRKDLMKGMCVNKGMIVEQNIK